MRDKRDENPGTDIRRRLLSEDEDGVEMLAWIEASLPERPLREL